MPISLMSSEHVLPGGQGLKIAVVVNDVAKVNIDSKLVRERTGTSGDENMADCVELQNGCACCNASDELLQVLFHCHAKQKVHFAFQACLGIRR